MGKLNQTIKQFLDLKVEYPKICIPILALEETEHRALPLSEPYRWLADEFYFNHRLYHNKEVRIKLPTSILRKFEVANTEAKYKELMLETMKAVSDPWAVHIYAGQKTDVKAFCKLFLFACDVLIRTVPVVHMTKEYWKEFEATGQPETTTRLSNNVVEV